MKNKFFTTALLFFTFLFFSYVFFIGIKNVFRYNVFKFEHNKVKTTLNEAKQKNLAYKKELIALENNKYWELLARSKLGYIKPEEGVYKFAYKKGGL